MLAPAFLGYSNFDVCLPNGQKLFEARLTKSVSSSTPGEAWFRISHNGRPSGFRT